MSHSHEEDLLFFGQSISTLTESASAPSIKQKASLKWKGHFYVLESNYDSEEQQVCLGIARDEALLFYQPTELIAADLKKSLEEQVKLVLERELDNLQSAFRLTSWIEKEPRLLNGVGLYFYIRNLWPEAEELFLLALKRRSDFSEAYKNLSQVYLKMGRPQKGVELLENAVRLNPAFADLHNALAWVYLESGRAAQAKVHLEQALKINPDYQEAHLNLALYYLQSIMHSAADFQTPAPAEATQALLQAARQDSGLADKVRKIASWDDASRLYLILKDRHNRRDTTNLLALCELLYARFLKDTENLSDNILGFHTSWLEEKVERGFDYPDLRNYLGVFYAYQYCLSATSVEQTLQNDHSSESNILKKSLGELKRPFLQICKELKV